MWKKFKDAYHRFGQDKPGERFLNAHERWKGRNSVLTTVIVVLASVVLFVVGLLLALIPGVPGIVLGLLGAVLLATRSRRVAGWLDWTEVKCRKLIHRCRMCWNPH